MKALIIILACLTLALVFTVVEKLRCLKHESTVIPLDDPDELKKALRKYHDLED